VDGVNAFIRTRPDEHPIEFELAGLNPEPWSVSDSLSVVYYMGWITSGNVRTEVLTQMLIEKLGLERARELFPLNRNPDEPSDRNEKAGTSYPKEFEPLHFAFDGDLLGLLTDSSSGLGSNNWAVSCRRSRSGKPIVANDPHLDSRILPGVWYPMGMITPNTRAVGVMIPGIPGMVIGRTDRVSMGVTNAYGDCQDLYVETLDPKDPGKYVEGDLAQPFQVVRETLRIRDKEAPTGYREERLEIKLTRRGPVVSGVLPGLRTQRVISLRWAASETMTPKIGFEELLTARSVGELRQAIRHLTFIVLNCVFADTDGNIGWHVSGTLPIRSQGDSTVPYLVKSSQDNWIGWIPFEKMPHTLNPERGWVGTCNHKTIGRDYPYYFSSYFAPSYRYQRLRDLLDRPTSASSEEHWQFQRDTMNLMAKAIAPVMASALVAHDDTRRLGELLASWDHRDDPNQPTPTLFQLVYCNFVRLVLQDELGEDLTDTMLEEGFFWQERLQKMVLDGSSPLFDNVMTKEKHETMDELFHEAAVMAIRQLSASMGPDPGKWLWGTAHQIEFVNPIRRTGFGKSLVGGGSHPMGGSRETLCCAWYDYAKPFEVILSASLRMVADLGDEDKVLAVLPGGVSGRTFDRHMKDQIQPFMRGEAVYWWFSDRAIRQHCKAVLELNPQ
jgi:penicillin amidase